MLDESIACYVEGKPILKLALEQIIEDTRYNVGVNEMLFRDEHDNMLTPVLAGIGVWPPARQFFERQMDEHFQSSPRTRATEIVVGAGVHAAIYCANSQEQPLVYDRWRRVGGIMGQSWGRPMFYLNSRNRPGSGLPFEKGGLNTLPGCPVEPNDLSWAEYPTNDDVAFCVRATLALCSAGVVGQVTPSVFPEDSKVIYATGIGKTKRSVRGAISFREFMVRLGRRGVFPLRGFKRVAVVGAGDSGKVAVEFLLGMGPQFGMSTTSLDYVQAIDWYGQKSKTKEEFEACERSRYKGIGRYMPRDEGQYSRIRPLDRWEETTVGAYDMIVDCTGFDPVERDGDWEPVYMGGDQVAERCGNKYKIGPAMNLPPTLDELQNPALRVIKDNSAALFRYGFRTQRFAEGTLGLS